MRFDRREFLKASGLAAMSFSGFARNSSARPQEKQPSRPNILYLHTHDIGRYIQPYGYDVPTPNMQKLAGEGVLFRNMFSAAPTCSPGRAAC